MTADKTRICLKHMPKKWHLLTTYQRNQQLINSLAHASLMRCSFVVSCYSYQLGRRVPALCLTGLGYADIAMKVIIKKMEDYGKIFDDYAELAKELPAEITIEDDNVLIVCGEHLLEIPREVFTGIGV
jgi:hypothetical protein